jgi:hypothetical protein
MEKQTADTFIGSRLGQIAWVVKDIQKAEKYFNEVMGVPEFLKMENLKASELEGTYFGKPADYVFHLYLAYSGDMMVELIQPVSGQSIFQDFLDSHPEGGAQHIAYMVPEAELTKAVSELITSGYSEITSLKLPVASVKFFDTRKEIGVVTEIIGVTEAGVELVKQMKHVEA